MLPLTADLPDPLVGLGPRVFEIAEQRLLQIPCVLLLRKAVHPCLIERIHDLAVDVDLQLLARGIADANGRRAFVAR